MIQTHKDESVMEPAEVFSIVTPSLNQGQFIGNCIRSVLSQKGDFYLDYIIVDGGSTDDSIDIIRQLELLVAEGEFAANCRGISFRWQSAPDRGQSDALRKGFELARGNILSWLNSDDLLLPDALQVVSSFFEQNPSTALLYGNARYCDQTGKVIGNYPAQEFDLDKLAYFNFMPQPATFFRSTAFENVNGIDSSLNYVMDYDLAIKIAKSFTCSYLPRVLAYYRLHEEAKTVLADTLHENHAEGLRVTMKHFGWAPLNLVYGSCYHWCLKNLPACFTRYKALLIVISAACTIFQSLLLNRGINTRDLQLLNLANIKKLFKDRRSILLGD